MTLAATRRYAFGASVLLGLAATLLAMALIAALVGDSDQVVIAMSDADFGAFCRVVFDRFLAATQAVLRLL